VYTYSQKTKFLKLLNVVDKRYGVFIFYRILKFVIAIVKVLLFFLTSQAPSWGRGTPFPLVHSFTFSSFAFLLFPFSFLIRFTHFLFLSTLSLSTRIVPLRFQAGGHRKRPNLGLVCCIYFMLSVFLS